MAIQRTGLQRRGFKHLGFLRTGLKVTVSPHACLNKRNGTRPFVPKRTVTGVNVGKPYESQRAVTENHTKGDTSPPCNIYVGFNFTVRIQEYFKFVKLTGSNAEGGIVHTQFNPLRRLRDMNLSVSAQKILTVPNAGGNSVLSEVLSFELFQNCFNAKLLKTEMEVSYFPYGGSITDYVCEIFGHKVGVSVTRAMKYRGEFTEEDAEMLLNKKLKGVVNANKNSLEKWNKQILHVWATNKDTANILTKVYDTLDPEVKANTVVMVTISDHAKYIFTNR